MALKPGALIWLPCEVKPGPFPNERLVKVASRAGEDWVGFVDVRYLKEPLDLVAEARAGLKAAPEDVPGLLKTLAGRLNLMALKGNLLLPDEQAESL